ncbi:MAG TPA: MBL fold metallo-hydrolase [Candidatus Polarisedimenticolia bacterium]|nr:MBL fold metallo-hydrolase [Candidatus Polarisedimenticolia bacterium]
MPAPSARSTATALVAVLVIVAPVPAHAAATKTKTRSLETLAEGVHVIRHPDAPDGFPQGNTTVVVGQKGVLVVDSCLLPSSARQDIEQIRKWTDTPVTLLVNTHWHFDHTLGNRTYAEAFPGALLVASAATRKTIGEFNPGAMARYPARGDKFRKYIADGKNPDGTVVTESDRKDYEEAIAGLGSVVAEFAATTQLVPTVGFRDRLDVDLGGRPVEIRWLGLGNTAGDTVVWLPNEKILIAGDLVVHPVPYLFGGFPVEFPTTLRTLMAIGASVIVPGHGAIQRDTRYVEKLVNLLETVNREVTREVNDGKTLEEAQAAVGEAVDQKALRRAFAGDDADDGGFFDSTFNALVKASYNQIKMR